MTEAFYGCEKGQENVLFIKKTVNLRKFSKEPVQISKPRYVKSRPLVNKRNKKGVPFLWRYKKGKGLDLGAEPLHIDFV